MEDIDTLRKINMVQKQKLERYAAIGGVTAGSSMIAAEAARADAAAKYPVLPKEENVSRRLKAIK